MLKQCVHGRIVSINRSVWNAPTALRVPVQPRNVRQRWIQNGVLLLLLLLLVRVGHCRLLSAGPLLPAGGPLATAPERMAVVL